MYLFVYGTLKKNKENHEYLKGAKFIEEAYIHGYFYDLGIGFPAVVLDNVRDKVYGEIYELDDDLLFEIDEFEGFYPDNPENSIFDRVETTAHTDSRTDIPVETYAMTEKQLSIFFAVPIKDDRWR